MKLTKNQLRELIKEEISDILSEEEDESRERMFVETPQELVHALSRFGYDLFRQAKGFENIFEDWGADGRGNVEGTIGPLILKLPPAPPTNMHGGSIWTQYHEVGRNLLEILKRLKASLDLIEEMKGKN